MIIIGNTLVSEDLFDQEFICNLSACKGSCCVEGDSGAPVTEDEKSIIEQEFDKIKPYLAEPSLLDIEKRTGFEMDEDGEWVTTCLPTGECNFVKKDENGLLSCGIEKSFLAGESKIRKPISCYLYPIRVIKVGDYEALNYHRWDICKAACTLGKQEKVAVYKFLKEPLISKFGQEWYAELEEIAIAYKAEQK
ncbi:MAG: hypothetical protein CFE21_12575 [Bacteroidetes bacterium B1(2017)]|nr:MAG: hypothetical protein CFE21_12575 [Bacteroidetes bacterium B1(2017)]